MKDQYNNRIPADLTLLNVLPRELTNAQLNSLDSINWYCFDGNSTNHIFVSQTELEKILDGLIDAESPDEVFDKNDYHRKDRPKIVLIDRVLHRWSDSGFYWAQLLKRPY